MQDGATDSRNAAVRSDIEVTVFAVREPHLANMLLRGFRAGFRPDSNRENIKVGPPGRPAAGRRADFDVFLIVFGAFVGGAGGPGRGRSSSPQGPMSGDKLRILFYVTQYCLRASNRVSGPDFASGPVIGFPGRVSAGF